MDHQLPQAKVKDPRWELEAGKPKISLQGWAGPGPNKPVTK